MNDPLPVSLVFSGGIALGSYQAGAWQALQDEPSLRVGWIAGSSIGCLNGALIAGCEPARRQETLEAYWLQGTAWTAQAFIPSFGGGLRHVANWANVMQSRLLGSPRHVQTLGPRTTFSSFYDLAPTVSFLRDRVDFGRLNGGDMRFSVCATDIESGDAVIFDTGKGDRIEMDHLMASCGFLPEFAPVEIGGRLLGDGGLIANAPIEPVLDEVEGSDATVMVLDLFARTGRRPSGLQSALTRKNALLFGNQTYARLDLYRRLWERLAPGPKPSIHYLSYQPVAEEAGAEMPFDFSHATAKDRWRAGFLDARQAVSGLAEARTSGRIVTLVRRPATDDRAASLPPQAAE